MTNKEVVKLLAKRLQVNQKTARERLRILLDLFKGLIVVNKKLRLPGMGDIVVQEYKARKGYIPSKGHCYIPERIRAIFKTSQKFKTWVKGQQNHES